MTLAILRERSADRFVVRLVGTFDARMADTVTQAILSAPELSVVVDLSELVSLDEGGLEALVDLSHSSHARGAPCALWVHVVTCREVSGRPAWQCHTIAELAAAQRHDRVREHWQHLMADRH